MLAASGGIMYYSSKKIKDELDEKQIPLMGVLGAFIFAAQMINFTIPGTGSSGHLGGAMILAILLGPAAAFLTMASVLTIQALFFADGGLLALGCNIFNLGFIPCFIAYPLIYKSIVNGNPTRARVLIGATLASVIGLQLGSLGVVLQTVFSGITELPFKTFLLLMQPIHLAIGLVEGAVTSAVVFFIWNARPEIIIKDEGTSTNNALTLKQVALTFLAAAIIVGGIFSWFASSNPDGLEWSIFKTAGTEEIEPAHNATLHSSLASIQEKTSILPDYGFGEAAEEEKSHGLLSGERAGTTVSGLVGGGFTLLSAMAVGMLLRRRKTAG